MIRKTIKKPSFTFLDLFSGIGGFRLPLEKLGGICVGFSEIDKNSKEVYNNNFKSPSNMQEYDLGDISKINNFPFNKVDLIVGGVPCQSWSVAGKLKGFDDSRGKLWFDTIRTVKLLSPKAFIFENVKGLYDPRNRKNLNLIIKNFEDLNYIVDFDLLNSADFGLPQNRERIFIVGIKKDNYEGKQFNFPVPISKNPKLYNFIDNVQDNCEFNKKKFKSSDLFGDKIPLSRNRFQKNDELNDFFILCDTRNGHTTIHSWDLIKTTIREKLICDTIMKNRRKKIYGCSDGNPLKFITIKKMIPNLQKLELNRLIEKRILKYKKDKGYDFVNSKNSSGINGIYRVFLPNSQIYSTLTATGTNDAVALRSIKGESVDSYKKEFIEKILKPKQYRNVLPREAARLQGFPESFNIHENAKIAKKQFGNAVSVPVIFYISKQLIKTNVFKQKEIKR